MPVSKLTNNTHCGIDEHAQTLPVAPTAPEILERAARLFRAVGEPARLRILAQLAQREMCVTEIAATDGDSLSTISQRLRVLRAENIIQRRRNGRHINYALTDQHMIDLVRGVLAHVQEKPSSKNEMDYGKENQE